VTVLNHKEGWSMIGLVACKHCGKEYYGTPRAQYCSGKCRMTAFRLRGGAGDKEAKQARVGAKD